MESSTKSANKATSAVFTVSSNALPDVGLKGYIIVGLLKILLMVTFSSGYMNELFVPFVRHYLVAHDNPWDFFLKISVKRDEFPYQPLMLYIHALFASPLLLLGWGSSPTVLLFMKLPTLLSDCIIARALLVSLPGQRARVFWFYWLSPIVLYACYMHSQLDLIPTAILFLAVCFMSRHKWHHSAIATGLALATKTHVAAALPLFLTFLIKTQGMRRAIGYMSIAIAIFIAVAAPYLSSPGFAAMVMHNPKQSEIFAAYLSIGNMKVFLPIFAAVMAYGRFAFYPKINADLFEAFLTIVFSLFVLLMVPAPGWYVWIAPFLSLFMIRYGRRDPRVIASCIALYAGYLIYFLFFHKYDYVSLIFLGRPLMAQLTDGNLPNVAFTLLEVILLANIVICYRSGVRSNSIYKRDQSIVIGIGGDSGSGKSTMLKDLKVLLHDKVLELEGDADHKWQRGDENWKSLTHLDPKANFLHRQAETIFNLKRGRTVSRVDYDHDSGTFTGARMVEPNDFIILSGLHTFYLPKLRKIIDLKIFLEPSGPLKTHWKLRRDVAERGYTQDKVVAQMNRRKDDVDKFIAPQRDFADICVQYAANETFDVASLESSPTLQLTVSMTSSIHLEDFVHELRQAELLTSWDYSDDLSRQTLSLSAPVPAALLDKLAADMIPNLDELVGGGVQWSEGFRGVIQLIVLMNLSELMKEKEDSGAS